MQGESVPSEPSSGTNPFLFLSRIVHFETEVDTQKKEVQVETYADSPVCCNAFAECIPPEERAFACGNICLLECPYVSGISEYCSGKLPEHIESIFHIGFQSD